MAFLCIFASDFVENDMKKLKQFDLSQLNRIFDGLVDTSGREGRQAEQEQLVGEYLSKHLFIARNPPIVKLMSRLAGDTYIMPEMRVIILTKGSANPLVNLAEHHFEAGHMVFMSPNSILQPQGYSDDIQGFGVSITDEIARLVFPSDVPKLLDGHIRDCQFKLTPEELQQVEALHSLLYQSMHGGHIVPQVTLSLTAAFLWQADYLWSRHGSENRRSLSREQRLFTDFVQLVSQYAPQEHNIDFYAQRLFLSPRYMSTLVKQVSGKAAKQWIDDAIVTRIKVKLRHTNLSAALIADEMHFPNPSFFCKFFKRMTGMTTQAYRAQSHD